jgi:hypothetical protein
VVHRLLPVVDLSPLAVIPFIPLSRVCFSATKTASINSEEELFQSARKRFDSGD